MLAGPTDYKRCDILKHKTACALVFEHPRTNAVSVSQQDRVCDDDGRYVRLHAQPSGQTTITMAVLYHHLRHGTFSLVLLLLQLDVSHGFVVRRGLKLQNVPPSSLSSVASPAHFHRQAISLASSSTGRMTTETSSSPSLSSVNGEIPFVENVIVGGGPAGLLAAIMLAQRRQRQGVAVTTRSGPSIHVYDRQPFPAPPPDDPSAWSTDANIAKYYLIGLGGRGQAALKAMGVWEDAVLPHCVAVVGRKDWPPGAGEDQGVERIFTAKDKKTTAQILPREKLVGILQLVISKQYADEIMVHHGCQVEPLDFAHRDGESVLLQVSPCVPISNIPSSTTSSSLGSTSADSQDIVCNVNDDSNPPKLLQAGFVIAADGTQRTFANAMERADERQRRKMSPWRRLVAPRPLRVKRYLDDNQRVYKTIPMKLPADWRYDLNYSARTKGSGINIDALPANPDGDYCAVLLLKHNDPFARADTDPVELRKWMNQYLPQFSKLLSDETMAAVAKKPVSFLPAFRYVSPRLHQGDRCVILGDCAHTVKPYFGMGANSALEDVLVLDRVLDACNNDVTKASPEFSKQRAPEAKTLVRLSRELDRPGKLGFITFILPIILDSIFSGLAPKLFTPNLIAMMQREQYTFTQVARRKRMDRLAQVAILGSGLGVAVWLLRTAVCALAAAIRRSVAVTMGICLTSIVGMAVLLKAVPALSPQAMMGTFADKVTNSRTHLTPLRKLLERMKGGEPRNGESFLTPLGFENKDSEMKSKDE